MSFLEYIGTPITGELAGSATAVQMPDIACRYVKFKAEASNAGKVYIGTSSSASVANGSTDTTTGYELSAGEETPIMFVTNLNKFWRICDNAGDDLTYMGLA